MNTLELVDKYQQVESNFLNDILIPYRDNCKYLKNCSINYQDNNSDFLFDSLGDFGILESCYIDDTGHFNAVEFNICYNQIAYTTLGHTIRSDFFQSFLPEHFVRSKLTYDIYKEKQLSSMFIVKIESKYLKPIKASGFQGRFYVDKLSYLSKTIFVHTSMDFLQDDTLKASGKVLLAFNAG